MLTKLLVPQALVVESGLTRTGFLVAMMALLFLLGLALESFSIILLTMPAILPVTDALGIDKVWYGILLTLSLEMALTSPPVAMNLMVIKAITGAPLSEVNRSIMPYTLMLAAGTALLIAFPGAALWLPRQAEYQGEAAPRRSGDSSGLSERQTSTAGEPRSGQRGARAPPAFAARSITSATAFG